MMMLSLTYGHNPDKRYENPDDGGAPWVNIVGVSHSPVSEKEEEWICFNWRDQRNANTKQ